MQQVQLLRSGNYQFFITGILDKDKDGNPLKRSEEHTSELQSH